MGGDHRVDRLVEALATDERPADALFGSALEAAAVRANPAVGEAIARARAAVPEIAWHLTGSGGALFALAHTRERANQLARRMSDAGFAARACTTIGSRG
jgi:4-diphosphocytidyl-2C-methyl-D-erythritol kinase